MDKLIFVLCFCLAVATVWADLRAVYVEESDGWQPAETDDSDVNDEVVRSLEVTNDDSMDPYFEDSTEIIDPPKGDLEDYHYHYDYHYHGHHGHHFHWHSHHHNKGTCTCSGEKCTCCVHDDNYSIHVHGKVFHLDACVDVTHIHDEDKYNIEVTSNGREIVHEDGVELTDNTKLCYDVPEYSGVRACAEFYDVYKSHACVKITGKIHHRIIDMNIDVKIACFAIHCNDTESAPNTLADLLFNRNRIE